MFKEKEMMEWQVIANNVYPRAFVEQAAAFQSLTTSISVAKGQKIIGMKTAQRQYVQASNEIGFELTLQDIENDLAEEPERDDLSDFEIDEKGITKKDKLLARVKESKHVGNNGK